MAWKLKQLYSWVVVYQEGNKLLGHCSICAKHKDEPGAPRAWSRTHGVELYNQMGYSDDDWDRSKDKTNNHGRTPFHKHVVSSH